MAEDIVTQLRERQYHWSDRSGIIWDDNEAAFYCEAADEIERLRAEVQEVWAAADMLATRLETISSGNTDVLREYDMRREEADRG